MRPRSKSTHFTTCGLLGKQCIHASYSTMPLLFRRLPKGSFINLWATSPRAIRQILDRCICHRASSVGVQYLDSDHVTNATISEQINAARGRLRVILHRELYAEVGDIVNNGECSCKELTTFEYLRELGRIEVWPLEDSMRNQSIQEMLERLSLFDEKNMRSYTNPRTGKVGSCNSCNQSWGEIVLRAASTVSKYFDGLCLDCMDLSKDLRSGGDRDDDYWRHNELRNWDSGCRIKHGEPTWYFSFMGRREKRGLIGD